MLHPRWGDAEPTTGPNSSRHQGDTLQDARANALYNVPTCLDIKEMKKFQGAGLAFFQVTWPRPGLVLQALPRSAMQEGAYFW